MTVDSAYLGPDAALLARMHVAGFGPSLADLPQQEADAMRERLLAARTWDDLSSEDQLALTRAIREVEAGASRTWENPDLDWLDCDSWAEQDRRRDELNIPDDMPVPLAPHEYNPLVVVEDDDEVEDEDEAEPELKAAVGDGSWVGL